MSPRWLLLAALTLVACSPALAQKAPADSSTGAACPAPRPILGKLPRGAVLDTAGHRLADGLKVWRILNRRDTWAVDDAWFQLPGRTQYMHLDSLYSLGDRLGLSGSARICCVRYRFPVKAKTLDEAKAAAFRERPPVPSKAVRREMEAMQREVAAPAAAPPR